MSEAELRAWFDGDTVSLSLFDAVQRLVDRIGACDLRLGKSQIAFRRRTAFAWAWRPSRQLKARPGLAPLVLSVGLRRRDPSPRWKQVAEPYPGRFTHHLELFDAGQLDAQVETWLREAWAAAI